MLFQHLLGGLQGGRPTASARGRLAELGQADPHAGQARSRMIRKLLHELLVLVDGLRVGAVAIVFVGQLEHLVSVASEQPPQQHAAEDHQQQEAAAAKQHQRGSPLLLAGFDFLRLGAEEAEPSPASAFRGLGIQGAGGRRRRHGGVGHQTVQRPSADDGLRRHLLIEQRFPAGGLGGRGGGRLLRPAAPPAVWGPAAPRAAWPARFDLSGSSSIGAKPSSSSAVGFAAGLRLRFGLPVSLRSSVLLRASVSLGGRLLQRLQQPLGLGRGEPAALDQPFGKRFGRDRLVGMRAPARGDSPPCGRTQFPALRAMR